MISVLSVCIQSGFIPTKQQWYISAMAVLQDQCTHRHKERRRICGTVEQHATAMAQQAQEPARWLSAKSRNKK